MLAALVHLEGGSGEQRGDAGSKGASVAKLVLTKYQPDLRNRVLMNPRFIRS